MWQCSFLLEGEWKQHGIPEKHSLKLLSRACLAMVNREVSEGIFATVQKFVDLMYDRSVWMLLIRFSLQETANRWRTFHLRRLSWNNMPSEQNISLAMCGYIVSIKTHFCQGRLARDRRERTTNPGSRSGQHFSKPGSP
jgi:hypothetical protein